jgi:hypothetical protein
MRRGPGPVSGQRLRETDRQSVQQRHRAGVVVARSGLDQTRSFIAPFISSRPWSVRTMTSVQSPKAPMPPVEMSACSAAKSGHCLQPSRV